jgi:hypothetical protein
MLFIDLSVYSCCRKISSRLNATIADDITVVILLQEQKKAEDSLEPF